MSGRKEFFESEVPGMLARILGDQLPPGMVSGLAMVAAKLYTLEAQVWEPRRLPPIYERLVPVDTSDGECALGRSYIMMESHGDTKEIARGADDLPLVDVGTGVDNFIPFKIGGLGYTYDTEDVRQAVCLGTYSRISVLPQQCFNIYEYALNEHTLFGNTRGGKLGFKTALFTSEQVTVMEGDTWDNASPQDLIGIFFDAIDAVWTNSGNTSYANTLAVPQSLLRAATRTKMGDGCCESALDFIRRLNTTTTETGQELTIIGVRGLELANATKDGPRLMAYERNPENLLLPLPMPLRFHQPQIRNLTFVVPAEYKYGPVHFRYPKSAIYVDFPAGTGQLTEAKGLKQAKRETSYPHGMAGTAAGKPEEPPKVMGGNQGPHEPHRGPGRPPNQKPPQPPQGVSHGESH
jgi:hypothetical protein